MSNHVLTQCPICDGTGFIQKYSTGNTCYNCDGGYLMVTEHKLKTWREFYQDVYDGIKKFEIRFNDRDFQVGDILTLIETDPNNFNASTGRQSSYQITYILRSYDALKPGYICMSIKPISPASIALYNEKNS